MVQVDKKDCICKMEEGMKEYICKEDCKLLCNPSMTQPYKEGYYGAIDDVLNLPTVIKADILKKIAEKCIYVNLGEGVIPLVDYHDIYDVLAEMKDE